MAKDKIRMPSTQGGLVQYYDEEAPSKFIIKPMHVIILTGIICIIGLLIAFAL